LRLKLQLQLQLQLQLSIPHWNCFRRIIQNWIVIIRLRRAAHFYLTWLVDTGSADCDLRLACTIATYSTAVQVVMVSTRRVSSHFDSSTIMKIEIGRWMHCQNHLEVLSWSLKHIILKILGSNLMHLVHTCKEIQGIQERNSIINNKHTYTYTHQ